VRRSGWKRGKKVRPVGEVMFIDKSLCTIEISKTEIHYIIKMKVGDEPHREFRGATFEETFEQVINEIQEEFNLNQ